MKTFLKNLPIFWVGFSLTAIIGLELTDWRLWVVGIVTVSLYTISTHIEVLDDRENNQTKVNK